MTSHAKINDLYEYLEKYGSEYPDYLKKYLLRNYYDDNEMDLVAQVKAKLGVLPAQYDYFKKFEQILAKHNLIRGNILEVGSGYYPILAERLSTYPDVKVTSVDPHLVSADSSNVTLIKGEFPFAIDVTKYDVIISSRPCLATQKIIEIANQTHKPFSILLCKCVPGNFANISTSKLWAKYVGNLIKYTSGSDSIVYEDEITVGSNKDKVFTKIYK